MAAFQPTLAFYIGHTFNPFTSSVFHQQSKIWQRAAEDFSHNAHVAAMMSDAEACSQIAASNAEEGLTVACNPDVRGLGLEVLDQAKDSTRLIILCVRYMHASGRLIGHELCTSPDPTIEPLLATLHKLKEQASRSAPPEVEAQSCLSRYVALLRSALLLLKTAALSADLPGLEAGLLSAKPILLHSAQATMTEAYASATSASHELLLRSASNATRAWKDDPYLGRDIEQAQHLSSLIIQVVLPVLRQQLKAPSRAPHETKRNLADICYLIMRSFWVRTHAPVQRLMAQGAVRTFTLSGMPAPQHCSLLMNAELLNSSGPCACLLKATKSDS